MDRIKKETIENGRFSFRWFTITCFALSLQRIGLFMLNPMKFLEIFYDNCGVCDMAPLDLSTHINNYAKGNSVANKYIVHENIIYFKFFVMIDNVQ